MSTLIKRMPALSFAAALALVVDSQTRLFAQDSSPRRTGARMEVLPPPARPEREIDLNMSGLAPRNSSRPYLGITFDLRYSDVAVARAVVPGGPADQAGLQAGDRIEAINDYPISGYRDAYEVVDSLRAGEIVDIDFSRRINGRTQAVVGGDPMHEGSTADYDGVAPAPTNSEPPAATFTEELLPEPAYDSSERRSNGLQFNGTSTGAQISNDRAIKQRIDESRIRPPNDRTRVRERGFRSRPLLPWRRN